MTVDEEIVTSGDTLYQAYLDSCKASKWKAETMKCSLNFLSVISQKQKELRNRTYKTGARREFIANERGIERPITSARIEDRIVRHAFYDNIVAPKLSTKLIYDNGASIKDKGLNFTRKRFEKHLHMLFNENGCNDGWILFGDFSKYYDNIQHEPLINDVSNVLQDEFSEWLYRENIETSRIDVSELTNKEIQSLMNGLFNSVEYRRHGYARKQEKFLDKSLDVGDQGSQISGVFYPTPIDNYVKIVRGHKMHDRYMDDFAIIHKDKQYLLDTLEGICKVAESKGIHINRKKTHIVKASSVYTFLQMRYTLTKTGHVSKHMQNTKVTDMCKKLKRMNNKLQKNEISYKSIEDMYISWVHNYIKYLKKSQLRKLNNVYNDLFIKNFGGGSNYEYNLDFSRWTENRELGSERKLSAVRSGSAGRTFNRYSSVTSNSKRDNIRECYACA